MSTYKVASASRKKTGSNDRGAFVVDVIGLSGGDGAIQHAEWFRSNTPPLPEVGSTLTGEVEDGKYGKQFKPERKGGFGGGGRQFTEDPARARAILRQHSQHMALLWYQISEERQVPWEQYIALVDRFDADVERARGTVASPPSKPQNGATAPLIDSAAKKHMDDQLTRFLESGRSLQEVQLQAVAMGCELTDDPTDLWANLSRAQGKALYQFMQS